MLNFYCRFLANILKHQVIFNEYLKHSKNNNKTLINRTEEATIAFSLGKDDLARAAALVHRQINSTLALLVDTSNYAIGAVS